MWQNEQYVLMEYVGMIIILCVIIVIFGPLYQRVFPANPGTRIGIALGGCIGVIGVVFGPFGLFAGIVLGGLLGGRLAGGIYEVAEIFIGQLIEHI